MFATFGNILGRPLSWFTAEGEQTNDASMEPQDESEEESQDESVPAPSSRGTVEPYEPSIVDVLVVKAILNKAFALPPELVNVILDIAEYWPHSTTERSGSVFIYGARADHEDVFLLRSKPLGFTKFPSGSSLSADTAPPRPLPLRRPYSLEALQQAINSPVPLLQHPCRKIVFTIHSDDQGWGGDPRHHGTYEGSWTWFDAGLEKFDAAGGPDVETDQSTAFTLSRLRSVWPEVVPQPEGTQPPGYMFRHALEPDEAHKIQANVLARRTPTRHRVVWSWTDDIDPDSPEALETLVAAGRGRATGNGEFVRSLTLGDVVTVWGRARFPAWMNTVEAVRIDVYWAV